MSDIILGVFIYLISQAMVNIGQILEKKGVDMMPKIEDTSGSQNLKNFAKNPIWLLGFILATASWYVSIPAINMAPLSLLSPLMGVGLIILVLVSYFYLKEPVSKKEIVGMLLIIVGLIILGVTATNINSTYTLATVNNIFVGANNLIYTALILGIIFFLIVFPRMRKYKWADVCFGLAAGMMMGIGTLYTKFFDGGFSDLIGMLTSWQWYIYVLFLLFGNVYGTVIQQMGFQHGKAIIVAPLVTIFSLLISTFGGLIVFQEWAGIDAPTLTLKVISLVTIVIGVAILSFLRTGTTTPKEPPKSEQKPQEIESDPSTQTLSEDSPIEESNSEN
jgi:multidrug transporter EmrE-like cation transporter